MRATVRVPATVANLGPGFDVLALALELQNEVEAERTDEPGLSLDCGPGAPAELLDPGSNMVVRGFRAAAEELGVGAGGVHLRCVNRIPMRRGLGSSAAAALGGVLSAAALHAAPWDEEAVLAIAAGLEGHPDNVAAALLGGLAIVTPGGRATTLAVPEELLAVVYVPDVELATERARAVVPATLERADAVFNAARCALLVRAVATRDWDTLAAAMDDRWHQRQRTPLFPPLPALIEAAVEAGARGAALAGAGPSVIALTDRDPEAVQRGFARAARSAGLAGRSIVSRVRNFGARVDVAA